MRRDAVLERDEKEQGRRDERGGGSMMVRGEGSQAMAVKRERKTRRKRREIDTGEFGVRERMIRGETD